MEVLYSDVDGGDSINPNKPATAVVANDNRPLKVRVDITEARLSSEVDQDAGRCLASVATTEATVANAATWRAKPLLQQ